MNFIYLLPFDLYISYLEMILFLIIQRYSSSCFGEFFSSTIIFNGHQHSFQMWQIFLNVSKSFFYKDSLFILTIKGKEGWRI